MPGTVNDDVLITRHRTFMPITSCVDMLKGAARIHGSRPGAPRRLARILGAHGIGLVPLVRTTAANARSRSRSPSLPRRLATSRGVSAPAPRDTPRCSSPTRMAAGPWTRSVPNDSGTAFGMNITSGSGSVAFVTIDSGVARTTVHNYTQQELVAAAASDCRLYPNARRA